MILKEFRVILPMTVEEYQVGQLYSVVEASKEETGGGEGVEILYNEPFDESTFAPSPALLGGDPRFTKGQYTSKIYHLKSKVPTLVRALAPSSALMLHENAWNAYPYCKTVLTNDYMKDDFVISVESMHIDGKVDLPNVHQLDPQTLSQVETIVVDIAKMDDPHAKHNPTTFQSNKTGRGPLTEGWWKNPGNTPVMCAYKLVRCHFRWWGLQTKIETLIMRNEYKIFSQFHKQVFCWLDGWYGLTMPQIREMEAKVKEDLVKQIKSGQARGHNLDE